MRWNPLHVSMETLIATSSLLGHELENRSSISDAQDECLAERLASESSTRLRDETQCDLFCVAPLDYLVSENAGQKQFHLLELNGTGIGGLTNLTDRVVCEVLESLADSCETCDDADGVVLLAVSGKESESAPRLNRLMHEKLLFVEAIRQGLTRRFGGCSATNLIALRSGRANVQSGQPVVVIGYMKELLDELTLADDGTVWLHGRRVMGVVNDRFCRNLLQRFDEQVDLDQLKTFNRCFAAGSDKGVAYGLMNGYMQSRPDSHLPSEICYAHAHSRLQLIDQVLQWLALGRQVVIKPHGTGLGHGIEFFLDPLESLPSIIQRIDQSLALTAQYYGVTGGALPYTVCDYVDASRLQSTRHPLCGHKYELRVVVYRHGMSLRAFPSIAKIARERDDQGGTVRRAMINNITASGDTNKTHGVDYMLPLCSRTALDLLGLSVDELESMCAISTGYVRHVLDQVQDRPAKFGLSPQATPRLVAASLAAA